jgi:hypothetical protein
MTVAVMNEAPKVQGTWATSHGKVGSLNASVPAAAACHPAAAQTQGTYTEHAPR